MGKIISYIRIRRDQEEIIVFEDEWGNDTLHDEAPQRRRWRGLLITVAIGIATGVAGNAVYAYMTT